MDNQESYSTNEITIYWNSPLTYLLAFTKNENTEIVQGDVNADGKFDIADAVLLQKWLLADENAELADWKAADLYKDSTLNVFDLCWMKQKLVQIS